MALTPGEIKAKKIAAKQKQINTKLAQIATTQARKTAKETVRDGYIALLATETVAKKIASLTKKRDSAIVQIGKYDATIGRYEAKRLEYAQQLAVIIGPV